MSHAAAPYFSLIVPVYKVERFLQDALDSVHEQTFTDYEVLCVDDGSPDGSGALLDEAARQDTRIRVVHQRNAGVSAARNRALDRVRGAYVLFLDPDDALCVDWFETFAKTIRRFDNPDQVRLTRGRIQESDDWRKVERPRFDASACVLAEGALPCARLLWPETAIPDVVYRMAWRADVMKDLRFPVGVVLGEDYIVHLEAAPQLRRVVAAVYPGVYYRERSGSAVMTRRPGSVRTWQHLCALRVIFR